MTVRIFRYTIMEHLNDYLMAGWGNSRYYGERGYGLQCCTVEWMGKPEDMTDPHPNLLMPPLLKSTESRDCTSMQAGD